MRQPATQERGCKQRTGTVGGSGACFDPTSSLIVGEMVWLNGVFRVARCQAESPVARGEIAYCCDNGAVITFARQVRNLRRLPDGLRLRRCTIPAGGRRE